MKHLSFSAWRAAGAGLALALLLPLTGCMSARESVVDTVKERTYFTPRNYNGVDRLPVGLQRVVLLPLCGGTVAPDESADALEEVFVTELQKTMRFEVVRLSREECLRRFGKPEISSVEALPHDFLATLGRVFGAEGVMFVDLTVFRGYEPLKLGVRAKLATVAGPRLLWSFDEIFSADDPAVANSVRHYYQGVTLPGVPVSPAKYALQSPNRFGAYVAAATFETLPPR